MSKGPVRRIRLRGVVAYPAVSVALVASLAFVLTPFGPSQGLALAVAATPTEITAAIATTTPDPSATTTQAPSTTTSPVPSTTTSPVPSATTSSMPSTTASPAPTSSPSLTPSPAPLPSPSLQGVAAPAAAFGDHHMLALIAGPQLQSSYLPIDTDVTNASQFQTFRVRFRLHNAGTSQTTATPQLEYRPNGDNAYVVVPEKSLPGIPFHVAREWVPSPSPGGGTMQGPLGEPIAVSDLKMGNEGGGTPATGHHSMGANPDQPITLPSASYTEEEFTVELTLDAKYLTGYQLRVTNGGAELTSDAASITLGSPPPVSLSPGQRPGVAVVDPTATNAAGVAYPLLTAQTIAPDTTVAAAVPASGPANSALYPLASGSLSPAIVASSTTVLVSKAGVQGSHSTMADQCGACHRGHTAQAPNLLAQNSQSALCFTCHDGTAASTNVKSQYTDKLIPKNDPATREYYSHDAATPATANTHTQSRLDEFGGVSNRHSECADCHNSHRAGTTDSTQTTDGWDVSGALTGVSGVSVVNGGAGTAPTYKFLDGVINPVTREYQLCFKCHSGATKLLTNIPGKPSTDALDKGVEFNPANASFHPVEAAGKNDTEAMKASLTKSSPYKLWNFNTTSTIRCLNCHAGGATDATTTPPLPLPGSALAPHTSSNRGILLESYKDRVLKSTNAAYSAGDFALCYVCHGEEPFAANGTASKATNFSLHSKHLTGLTGKGDGGTDIDKAGAGEGNAICAECHFRIHSTTNKVGTQTISGSRLVNFAPNVQPVDGTISWTQGATASGSCTLTCHGFTHDALKY
jgi:predicted CXXCH cytochrome family protein